MDLPDPAKLRIVSYPDPALRRQGAAVTEFGADLEKVAIRMLELMHEANGVGLAAPQVGVSARFFVCNPTGEPADDSVCINPRFTELSGAAEQEEGCLSIPGATVTVRRAGAAVMSAFDLEGKPFEVRGEDLLARIWQHENDHLDGRLIIDNMSPTDEISNRRILKQLRGEAKAVRRY